MDINACIELIREGYATGEDVTEHIDNALAWIRGGGFMPRLTEPQLSGLLLLARLGAKSSNKQRNISYDQSLVNG